MTMRHRTFSPRFLFTLVVLLPLLKIGCDGRPANRKCFAWTKAEGACPAQTDALRFFSDDGSCPFLVQYVHSEGEFLGDRCCYVVTDHEEPNPECVQSGAGGASVISSVSSSVSGGPACLRCSTHAIHEFQSGTFFANCWVSPQSEALWNALFDCLCVGACQSACTATVCGGVNYETRECFDCASDISVGCGHELSACMNDI